MSHKPRVSVVLPSYNHAKYLPAAIESVLGQTFQDFELIVVDDGSTDESLQIAEAYAARYPDRVHVFTHPERANKGISETVNYAYTLSRGEFWCGLPSDDLLHSEKLAQQVNYLDSNPDAGWVYSYAELINETGQLIARVPFFGEDILQSADPLQVLIERNVIPGMTVLMRRSSTDIVGLHDPKLIYSDWEFWIRLMAESKAGFIAKPLVRYRVHSYNLSAGVDPRINMNRGREVARSLRLKSPHIGGVLARPRIQALLCLQEAYHAFGAADAEEVRKLVARSFEVDRTLANDQKYFSDWLMRRRRQSDAFFPKGSVELGFDEWLVSNFPRSVGRDFVRRIAAVHYAMAAMKYDQDRLAIRQFAVKCIARDPTWVGNASFRAVLVKSLIGATLTRLLRSLRIRLSS